MTDPARLLQQIDTLIARIRAEAADQSREWMEWGIRADFVPSVENFAAYLALRHHDLRALQNELMALGLSSLGRLESRVMPTLAAVRRALAAMTGQTAEPAGDEADFFAGSERIATRSAQMFGEQEGQRRAALMVTCPAEAADDPAFMVRLAQCGVDAIRINCAHDDAEAWDRMIAHARTAEAAAGRRIKVFMDLAGPKIRIGEVRLLDDASEKKRVFPGDRIAITRPGHLGLPLPEGLAFAMECTLEEAVGAARPDHRLFIDDGKIAAIIEHCDDNAFVARVTRCKAEGAKLKAEKGINFPDSNIAVPALTAKDRADLTFVATHADGVSFSFVQSPEDVELLQDALAELRPDDWSELSLILKIETATAVRNLPEIVVRAGARQPTGIMIARGDLAIEIGFTRLAEMQEEILWIGEAAQVPVIWATQVLEHLVKEGMGHRGELTDAAMAVRAECVMLNKGPYLFEAIAELDKLLSRMNEHVDKKTPRLRRLRSW